jgi:hypothetical protein
MILAFGPRPEQRQCAGLVPLIAGGEVIAITSDHATIKVSNARRSERQAATAAGRGRRR